MLKQIQSISRLLEADKIIERVSSLHTEKGFAERRELNRTQPRVEKTLLFLRRKQVGLTGIEPALPKELDPKSSASASSATAPTVIFLSGSKAGSQVGSVYCNGASRRE